jgi:hypothetical protein
MTTCIENLVSLNLYRTAVDQTTIIAILCDNRERGAQSSYQLLEFLLYFIFLQILILCDNREEGQSSFLEFFYTSYFLRKCLLFRILLSPNFSFVRFLDHEPSFFIGSGPGL